MAKAIFKFDLNDFDDLQEFRRMSKAKNMAAALWDIKQRIRDSEKYDKPPITLEEFHEVLNNNDVNLDEIYS